MKSQIQGQQKVVDGWGTRYKYRDPNIFNTHEEVKGTVSIVWETWCLLCILFFNIYLHCFFHSFKKGVMLMGFEAKPCFRDSFRLMDTMSILRGFLLSLIVLPLSNAIYLLILLTLYHGFPTHRDRREFTKPSCDR